MTEHKDIIIRTIDDIKETVALFYQRKDGEALVKFESVISGIMESMNAIDEYKKDSSDFTFDESAIMSTLTEAMDALQNGDYVLLADILQYDFLEYLQELSDQME